MNKQMSLSALSDELSRVWTRKWKFLAEIDRCMADYQTIYDKMFYLIVTAADSQRRAADDALADFRRFLRCLPGTKEAAVILGTGTWDKDGVYRHPATPEAYEMERSL